MEFEAHYKKGRLIGLAVLGLAFIALGYWMAHEPAGALDESSSSKLAGLAYLFGTSKATMGYIVGWACALLGALVIPVVVGNWRHRGPAIRIDARGILFHRWSDARIPWSNIAAIEPYKVQRQKMVGLTLIDRTRDRPQTLMGKFAGVNRTLGFGDLALTVQGTDGNYEDMLEVLAHYHVARS